MVSNFATVSLPHAADALRRNSPLSSTSSDVLISQPSSSINDLLLNRVDENKWVKMSRKIELVISSSSEYVTTNISNTIDNKWAMVGDTTNTKQPSTQQQTNKRDRSPSTLNKWAVQAEQLANKHKKT